MIWLNINKKLNVPITKQIYQQIRNQILCKNLKSSTKLPSSRALAEHLHVSRNVILEAYNMLLLEGYIFTKPSSGTFVSELPQHHVNMLQSNISSDLDVQTNNPSSEIINFHSGIPALDLLPLKRWNQLYTKLLFDLPSSLFGYGSPQGTIELRHAICNYLQRMRGIICQPSQVIITNSSIQSFSILANILLNNNACYILEDPLHYNIRKTFSAVNKNYYIVPADKQGILTQLLPKHINPAFIFVTPSHQYPLGGLLSVQRRIELINYVKEKDCYIIEDDYDSEFHYKNPPLSTLYELSPEHVIYTGTFSKVICPTLRIGYMIVPEKLISPVCEYKKRCDYFTSTLTQLTLANFINDRFLERHINKMQKIYLKRRNTLIDALLTHFNTSVHIQGESTGLHLVASFTDVDFTPPLLDFLNHQGIKVFPLWIHSTQVDYPKNTIILGYSHLTPETITQGIHILKKSLSLWHNSHYYHESQKPQT